MKYWIAIIMIYFSVSGLFAQQNDDGGASYTFPNHNHFRLDAFAGNWKLNYAIQPENNNAIYSKGTAENNIICDGRYLEMDNQITLMQSLYQVKIYVGYDNVREEYTMIIIEGLTTNPMILRGHYEEEKNMYVFEGTTDITKEIRQLPIRAELKLERENKFAFAVYVQNTKGQMELSWTWDAIKAVEE